MEALESHLWQYRRIGSPGISPFQDFMTLKLDTQELLCCNQDWRHKFPSGLGHSLFRPLGHVLGLQHAFMHFGSPVSFGLSKPHLYQRPGKFYQIHGWLCRWN